MVEINQAATRAMWGGNSVFVVGSSEIL